MKKYTRILIALVLLSGVCIFAFADRGGFVKHKKAQLNVPIKGTLSNSVAFDLKSGTIFRGSELLSSRRIGNTLVNETIISYKKGNTIYLLPYKQRILIPKFTRDGGSKLIIRSK